MEFPTRLIPELVPNGLPPDRYFVGQVDLLSERMEDETLRRSYLWSNALMIAGLESNLQIPSRLLGFSTGFVYLKESPPFITERMKIIEGFSFGISILISSTEDRPQEVRVLEVGRHIIPVVVNFGAYELHGLPTHPGGGSGCCWIEKIQNGRWHKGILTCRHTLANAYLGSNIPLHPSRYHSMPNLGHMADRDACTIDAAIVDIDENDWPTGLSPLPICHVVAPGQRASFEGRSSSRSGTVLRVFQHPGYIGNLFGQRIFTDCVGLHGDSGSLLTDPNSAQGLGIYMGSVPDGAGGREGLFQHLSQASSYFGFSTYI